MCLLSVRVNSSHTVRFAAYENGFYGGSAADPGLRQWPVSAVAEVVKVKVKVRTLDIAPLRQSSPQKRSGMTRVLKGSHSYLHTHTFTRNRNEPHLPLPSKL